MSTYNKEHVELRIAAQREDRREDFIMAILRSGASMPPDKVVAYAVTVVRELEKVEREEAEKIE